MPYLIDGHNLIGKLPDISLDDPNDEALLVQKLLSFAARTSKRCVVVFDNGIPGGESRMSTPQVKVVFAPYGKSADHVMLGRISGIADPKNWTVVSSDNAVLEAGRRRKMHGMKSSEFAALLMRSPEADKPGPDEAVDVRLSAQEVKEWMNIFGLSEPPTTPTPTSKKAQPAKTSRFKPE